MPTAQKKSLVDALKANPLVTVGLSIVLITTTVTGVITGIDSMDELVMTHAEHDADMARHEASLHASTKEAIDELKSWNRCARLERRLEELANRKWRLEHPPEGEAIDQQAVRDADRDIAAAERQYRALQCAQVLAG